MRTGFVLSSQDVLFFREAPGGSLTAAKCPRYSPSIGLQIWKLHAAEAMFHALSELAAPHGARQ
jgi:hypothetical protein